MLTWAQLCRVKWHRRPKPVRTLKQRPVAVQLWWNEVGDCGQTDLRGLEAAAAEAAAARPLRRSVWSPAPRSRGSLPSSSGLTGRVLARHSTARSWSSPKMSHLPTNFCLLSLSQGHSAIKELVSFRRLTNPPAGCRPLFLPARYQRKSLSNFKESRPALRVAPSLSDVSSPLIPSRSALKCGWVGLKGASVLSLSSVFLFSLRSCSPNFY